MEDFGNGGFGDPDFSSEPANGGGSKFVKEKSVPEGVSRFRFLPPMKSLAAKREGWKVWGAVHYGYSGTKKNKPDETVQRPFGCVQKKDRSGAILRTCEGCTKHAKYKAEAEIHLGKLKEQGLNKDQIREDAKMKQLNDWLWDHNCDKKYRVAALESDEQTFVVLKINYTLMKDIDQLFTKLARDAENPINPLSVNQGVWLEFTRDGKNFRVDVVKERVNIPSVGVVEKIKLAPLSAQQQQDALARVQDLTTCISVLSPKQIEMIVNGPQDPESIDAVWALGSGSLEVSPEPVRTEVRTEVARPATVLSSVPVSTPEDDEAALLRKLEALRAKKSQSVTATITTPLVGAPPTVPPPSGVDMSDEDFLKLVGGK
jgi:hypothetical protein